VIRLLKCNYIKHPFYVESRLRAIIGAWIVVVKVLVRAAF
jgi:hypothetical protein